MSAAVPPRSTACHRVFARRSDTPTAPHRGRTRNRRGASQAGSCQTAKDGTDQCGTEFLARSKRGTRFMPAWISGGTRYRERQFCASGWEETKEGAAVWWLSPDDRNPLYQLERALPASVDPITSRSGMARLRSVRSLRMKASRQSAEISRDIDAVSGPMIDGGMSFDSYGETRQGNNRRWPSPTRSQTSL